MIRPARHSDVFAMCKLLEQLFSIEQDFVVDEARQRSGLEMVLESDMAALFVAEKDGAVIGMISAQLVISTAEGGLSMLIEDLVVEESHRNQGAGKALLGSVEEWGRERGVGRMQLLADCDNRQAMAFYRAQGLSETRLVCLRTHC